MEYDDLVVDQRVEYSDVNLKGPSMKGTITTKGTTPKGGDCRVRWDRYPGFQSEECSFNLSPASLYATVLSWE